MKHYQYLSQDISLKLDRDACNGCRTCTDVCPHGVLEMSDGKASIVAIERCMECGACSMNCAQSAIEVEAGVGCAAAVVNAALGRQSSGCCNIDQHGAAQKPAEAGPGPGAKPSCGCG